MSSDQQPDPRLSRRKIRDRSVALLIVGTLLLLPPVAGISLVEARVFGVPFPLLYVFLVWAALIAGAARLAGRLQEDENLAERMPPGPRGG